MDTKTRRFAAGRNRLALAGHAAAVRRLLALLGLAATVLLTPRALPAATPIPPPVPPVYTKLKDLHLVTELVRDGKPNCTVVAPSSGIYAEQARRIQETISKRTGVQIPLANDEWSDGDVLRQTHTIVLGNRSTNRALEQLYNQFHALLDLRYPGPGGFVVRTLHNPFGDGHNVILVGGSDLGGVAAAAGAFVEELAKADAAAGRLTISWLARIRLGDGVRPPRDVRAMEIWDASEGYGSVGYFGWNSISKHMAMYYMTGEEFHAREFLRLAFPDDKARREIAEIDGERIENKDAPLSGPYHYNAHMMILFWDLIEESPVFSDEQRLRVTNAFSQQLNHRKSEGVYGRTSPPAGVGSRHGQWSAISLYCLGRYFQKDYPDPVWRHCVESAQLHFEPLHHHAWVSGENDNLFWYNTGIAPILAYLVLSGDRAPVKNGVLSTLLRGQEMLASGLRSDWALNSAAITFLHQAAYLTQDGRFLGYRQRLGLDIVGFRLGQSFWPEEHLTPTPPADLVHRWSVNQLPRPMWQARRSGIPFEESFQFGSYRSATDASGDFILIDGFNGASRNPYHTFAILELRLDGYTLLRGYRNQLLTSADGLVEPLIAMDAALKDCDVLGSTAAATGEVQQAAYCNWRRTLVQRVNRYALIADHLRFRTDADNMEVQLLWETDRSGRAADDGHIECAARREVPAKSETRGGRIWNSRQVETTCRGSAATMAWMGPVRTGQEVSFFSLLGVQPEDAPRPLGCYQLAESAAAMAIPSPAVAAMGRYAGIDADIAVVDVDHVYGKGVRGVSVPRRTDAAGNTQPAAHDVLLTVSAPVDVDWDLRAGTLCLAAAQPTRFEFAMTPAESLLVDGKRQPATADPAGRLVVPFAPGRHRLEEVIPPASIAANLSAWLADQLEQGRRARAEATRVDRDREAMSLPRLAGAFEANVPGAVTDLLVLDAPEGPILHVAEGSAIHRFTRQGKSLEPYRTDGAIRMLRWWPEHGLLLAGCADERVIAFDRSGQRRWVFNSEMDPEVFRAGKTYWFKSEPGHEGIHGLTTGVFLEGKSQAFVGSACTLEILDENGRLIRRMPQFWGKVSHFAFCDGPQGSINLLASRIYNGTNDVAIINNRTLDPNPRGFASVPPGCTFVPGWSSMNRRHVFYEDFDGDGVKEVMSETNGTWNRVTIWRVDGRALYDASFGPGERIPAVTMRDVDVCDLDGNGTKEILAATSRRLVVALDHQCRKVWATRLKSPATAMKCVRLRREENPWVIVACEDGSILGIDSRGKPIRSDAVKGRATCIELIASSRSSPLLLVATDQGQVKGFGADP